jgi:hypothetical protein
MPALAKPTVTWVVEPSLSYDNVNVHGFSEGLAAVGTHGGGGATWGFIDTRGNLVVPIELGYDTVRGFSGGLSAVSRGGKWGFIDTSGDLVIPLEYDTVWDFDNGLAAVSKDGRWGFIDTSGNVVLPLEYNRPYSFSDGLAAVGNASGWGFMDKNGNVAIPFEHIGVNSFSEGLAAFQIGYWPDHKWGFMDKNGNEVIPPAYSSARSFSEGLAAVLIGDYWGAPESEFVFIDKSGNVVIRPGYGLSEYMILDDFRGGLAAVSYGNKMGFINKSGTLVIPMDYDESGFGLSYFIDGLAAVRQNNLWGVIDTSGNVVVPFEYFEVRNLGGGLVAVTKGDDFDRAWKLIYRNGETILPIEYNFIPAISDGYMLVQKNWQWGIVRFDGLSSPVPTTPQTATPTTNTVIVNGANTPFDAYLIGGNNFFKLRDLAYVLNGTAKQFNVEWDSNRNAILLTSGTPYAPVGGEMTASTLTGQQTANPTASRIYLDGVQVEFTAYFIGGNNFFRLRDVMQTFDVYVGWNEATGTITLDTSRGYEE